MTESISVTDPALFPTPFQHQLPTGLTLAGLRWGRPEQPTLVALHGWLDNAATFTEIAPVLARDFQVLALDLAGHGFSGHRPPGVRYHLLDNLDDVLFLLDAWCPDPVHLLGHSMGAGIACYVAALAPERIDKLVCLEGLGSMSMLPAEALSVMKKAVTDLQKLATPRPPPLYQSVAQAVAVRAKGMFKLSDAAALALTQRSLKAVAGGYTWCSDSRLKMGSAIRLTEAMVENFLAGIRAKTLLIGARQGYYHHSPALFQARMASIADVEACCLPGGHHFHLEPETAPAVAAAIGRFLASANATGSNEQCPG